jgi:hypothetical protein
MEHHIKTVEEHLRKVVAYHQRTVRLEKMEACLENTEAKDLGANPEEIESKAGIGRSLKKRPQWKKFGALKKRHEDRNLDV